MKVVVLYVKRALFILMWTLLVTGCAPRQIHHTEIYPHRGLDESVRIAVTPLCGDVHLRGSASEWLAFQLEKSVSNPFLSPFMVEYLLRMQGLEVRYPGDEHDLPSGVQAITALNKDITLEHMTLEGDEKMTTCVIARDDLIRIGEAVDAEVVIGGYVTTTSIHGYGLIGLEMIDVRNRAVMATIQESVRPEQKHLCVDDVHTATRAVEKAAAQAAMLFDRKKERE